MQRWRPRLSTGFNAGARAYALDLVATAVLYVGVSLAAGRVWRLPFDDEVSTLGKLEHLRVGELLVVYLKGRDVHPPLSYVLLGALHDLGLSDAAMRLVSLAMMASALLLLHALTLALIARSGQAVAPMTRLIAVLLFGLNALAISQGDALRWYPLFALEVAAFLTLYLAGGNCAARLASAALLGLAASTNFLAALLIAPFALYRYGLERRFRPAFDGAFWVLVLLFGSLGLCTALYLFGTNFRMVGTQLGNGIMAAALADGLGFFGGHALGAGQAWVVMPSIAVAAVAMMSQIDRKEPANPANLLLLMLVAVTAMPLIGFAKPRSFLYLAPVMAMVLTLYLDRLTRRHGGLALLLAATLVAASAAAIANIESGTHPFKRTSVVPYGAIVDFIRANEDGRVLVISTDPVLPWVLDHSAEGARRCASFFLSRRDCLAGGRDYDTVFVVSGHSDRSGQAAVMRVFDEAVERQTAGKRRIVTLQAGVDDDAALKTRLTGVPLTRAILTVDLYR